MTSVFLIPLLIFFFALIAVYDLTSTSLSSSSSSSRRRRTATTNADDGGDSSTLLGDSMTPRRLLWSEQWIVDRMAELEHEVELFDYEPQLIVDEAPSTALSELREPLRWSLDGFEHRFRPACGGTTVAHHNAFERAWAQYVTLHRRITSGELPPRFVHVGFPPEAGLHARLKLVVSATLMALALQRAVVISWVPTPRESGMQHTALVELFRSPGFDWWYTSAKYAAPRYRRLSSVVGFGQESDATLSYEPEALLCADLRALDASWLELHWKYDAFAAALRCNPTLRDVLAPLVAADDLYGPLARKLFFPHKRLWKKIMAVYEQLHAPPPPSSSSTASLFVVGVELNKQAETKALLNCLDYKGCCAAR